MSSLFGLKAAPRTAMRLAGDRTAADLAGEVDHPHPAAHVDRVDLAEEGQGLVGAQFAGPCHERANVLRQATAAEAKAGVQESCGRCGHRGRWRRRAGRRRRPLASQTSAMALMKEILVARNEFAAALTSSAVA